VGTRALRDFGDGFVAVLLPVYLTALGLGALEVGVVATLALLGSALMTLEIGLLAARTDQRRLLSWARPGS
jgi:MFS family permease